MDREKVIGYIAIILTAFFWGISFISIDKTVRIFKPMSLGAIRFFMATILLFIIIRAKGPIKKASGKDLFLLMMAGVIGITIYFFFENNGVMYTGASSASLIIATIPIFTSISDGIFFREKITLPTIFALIVSVAGVYLITKTGATEGSMKGNLYMFGAVFSWVFYAVVSKDLFKRFNQLDIIFYQALFGFLFFLPFAAFETIEYSSITTEAVLHVIFLGVFASAAGFFLYLVSVDKLGLQISSLFLNFIPVVTVFFSVVYLKESIGMTKYIGALLIMISIFIPSIRIGKKLKKQ